MTVSKLTKEQIEILSNYSQVARTTDTSVVFTQTFKRHFCEEYMFIYLTVTDAFKTAGSFQSGTESADAGKHIEKTYHGQPPSGSSAPCRTSFSSSSGVMTVNMFGKFKNSFLI